MADPSNQPISCVLLNCDKTTSTCEFTCVPSSDPFLSPPPPSPVSGNSSQTHFAPFLIAIVCFLGVSFLLLTTCTIILRYRFKLRRRNSVTNDETLIGDNNDGGIGGGVDHPIWYIQTVGLQQSVIDSITASKYKKADGFSIGGSKNGVNNCAVCLSDFDDGDDVRLLPKCCHCFHVSCIDTWLRSHKTCPICRSLVVHESGISGVAGVGLGSEDLVVGGGGVMGGLEENTDGFVVESESSSQLSESGDGFVALDIVGLKFDEVLKRNGRLRIQSDLGENYRFSGKEERVEPIRRSFSFNALVAATIDKNVSSVWIAGNEGCTCSSNVNFGHVLQENKIGIEKGSSKRGSSFSGMLMKSSSVGPSLQKGPFSMKRSRSSSGRLFSFRKTRNQASILPL